jgi:hypothetical protein
MSNGVHSKNPRVRGILIATHGVDECCICGKSASRHPGHRPAPVSVCLEFLCVVFKNHFAPDNPKVQCGEAQIGVPQCLAETGWELGENLRVGGALCLACAKRISSRLDAVIDQIESEYRENRA